MGWIKRSRNGYELIHRPVVVWLMNPNFGNELLKFGGMGLGNVFVVFLQLCAFLRRSSIPCRLIKFR